MRFRLALIAAAFAVLYAPACRMMFNTWLDSSGRDDYSHGFIAILAAVYLTWRRRAALRDLPIAPNLALGIPATSVAAAILLAGNLTATAVLEQISLLAMIGGLLLLLAGSDFLKTLALPLYLLSFAFPLFDDVMASVDWPLQLLAAHNAALLLRIVGVPVYRDAQYLHLPNLNLEVAAACSGARYLISVIAVTIPLAYLILPTWRRRIGLVSFAAAIAILANGARVALIAAWVTHTGADFTHRPDHTLQGLFVYWIGIAAIFVAARFLRPRAKATPCPAVSS